MSRSTAGSTPSQTLHGLFAELPRGRILNLGCGRARVQTPGQTVSHVDHVAIPGLDDVIVASGDDLPFEDGYFDGALLKDVIEHVVDTVGLLAEVRRTCHAGGRLLVTTPRAVPRAVWADPTHIRGFTRSALVQALQMSGWRPLHPPRRLGGFPGAGRLRLYPYLESIMKVPGFGHYFGTNWIVRATAA